MSILAVIPSGGACPEGVHWAAMADEAIGRQRERPLHLYGHVLGLEYAAEPAGPMRGQMPADPWREGAGFVSPGAEATLGDICLGAGARWVSADPGLRVTTVALHLYHLAVPRGDTLYARSHAITDSPAGWAGHGDICDAGGQVCTLFDGVFARVAVQAARPGDPGATPGPGSEAAAATFRRWMAGMPERMGAVGSAYRAYMGFTVLETQPRRATLRMPCGPHTANMRGEVQGGLLYGLSAEAMGVAAAGDGAGPFRLLEMKGNYLLPGAGGHLTARAEVLRSGRRLLTAMCRITDDRDRLVNLATGTLVAVEA